MSSTLTIYRLVPADGGSLQALAAGPTDKLLRGEYGLYRALTLGAAGFLGGYTKTSGDLDLYVVGAADPWLKFAGAVAIGPGWDEVRALTFCNVAFVMTYRADTGQFGFFALDAGLKQTGKYFYQRFHAPAASQGFTMVTPFVQADGVVIMGYGFDTGVVAMYRLAGVVSSGGGVPPIAGHTVWDHVWAQGWTRFAFFQLGGEVFFLKTNTKYPNVNIDHVNNDPTTGTIEVSSQMDLANAQTLTLVEAFSLGYGDPCFIAYRPDGLTVVYRIHSDCRGWTPIAHAQMEPAASALLPTFVQGPGQLFIQVAGGQA